MRLTVEMLVIVSLTSGSLLRPSTDAPQRRVVPTGRWLIRLTMRGTQGSGLSARELRLWFDGQVDLTLPLGPLPPQSPLPPARI